MEEILRDIGLNKKEVRLYLALLQLGQATAFEVARKAKLKRPTAYVVLERLQARGLVAVADTAKARHFSALAPKQLIALYDAKARQLKAALPGLEAIYNTRPEKPRVELHEGAEGMKTIYYEAIGALNKGEEVLFFSTFEHIELYLKDELKQWQKTLRANPKARARELLNDTPLERAYAVEMGDIDKRYPIRFIPKNFGQIHADFILFGDKVAFVSAHHDIFATVMESAEISAAFRVLYEMAWQVGQPAARA